MEKEEHVTALCGLLLMYNLMKKLTGTTVLVENDERIMNELMDLFGADIEYGAELDMIEARKQISNLMNRY